ncbi:hypothetical protein D9M70_452700 [compost metagenome]
MNLADGAFVSVCRVGGAHDFAVLGDCVFAFENLNDGRAGGHELDQFAEERTFLVNGVEAFGFAAAHPDALGSDDAQAGIFEHLGDGAGQVALGRVRLDHREGTFNSHWLKSLVS